MKINRLEASSIIYKVLYTKEEGGIIYKHPKSWTMDAAFEAVKNKTFKLNKPAALFFCVDGNITAIWDYCNNAWRCMGDEKFLTVPIKQISIE